MIGINGNPPDQSHRPRRNYGVDVRKFYLPATNNKTLTFYAYFNQFEWLS